MKNRFQTVFYVTALIAGIASVAVMVTVGLLYNAAFNQTRKQLADTVNSHANLIEAVAKYDRIHSPEDSVNATISQIVDAHRQDKGFGETGEFTLATLKNDMIVFLLSHRHKVKTSEQGDQSMVPFKGKAAEPMRLALLGRTGTVVGVDYRGKTVLAAYRPIAGLNCGIVAKIDLAEIRRPFIGISIVAILTVVLLSLLGVWLAVGPLFKRLDEGAARITSIVETAVDPIITITSKGLIESYNSAAEKLFGYSMEEAVGNNISMLMPSPYREAHNGYLARYMKSGKKNIIGIGREAIGKKKDGTTFPLMLSVSEVQLITEDSSQSDRLFTGFIRDLTEQKQREEELIQATQKAEKLSAFGDIIDRSLNEILIFEAASLRFIHANHGACRNLGYTLDELQQMTPLDIKPEFTQASIAELLYPLFDGSKDSLEFETVYRRKDGSEYPGKVHYESSTFGGRPVIVAIVLDITEQKKSEERLRKLSAAVEQSPVSIVITDIAGTIEYVNEQFTRSTGYAKTEVIGGNPRLLNSGETPKETYSKMWASLSKGEVWRGEFHNQKKNGELYWELATIAPIRNSQGETTHFVALKEDVTQKKQMRDNLIQAMHAAEDANRAKSEFLANMSHEIRTPMTAILGYTDLLFGDGDISKAPKHRIEAIETIKRNGHFLLGLINDILDLSKIEAGKLDAEQIDTSPHEIISDVFSLMKVRSESKGLQLNVQYDGPIPKTIFTDPTRLRQIIINVVGNAIKFTETGTVQIIARLLNEAGKDPQLQIDVTDTGIGIDKDKIEKLFMPFTQADGSMTRKFGGTGLGLAIGKRLTELLGGSLSVTSIPGKGSTFSIIVSTGPLDKVELVHGDVKPASTKVITEKTETQKASTKAPLQNCRILFAEDGPDNQKLIGFLLKKAGAEVTLADNGQISYDLATSALAEGNPFDVILTDMQMPVMDGYESTRKLRENGYRGSIIALTAHAMQSDRQLCLDAGCDNYTTKPVNRKELIEMVASYAGKTSEIEMK